MPSRILRHLPYIRFWHEADQVMGRCDFRLWHETDVLTDPENVCYRVHNGPNADRRH